MSSQDSRLKRRPEEDNNESNPKKLKTGSVAAAAAGPLTPAQVAAMVAQKSKEIAERMAAMKKQGVLPGAAPVARPPPGVPSGGTSAGAPEGIEEIRARIARTLAANPNLSLGSNIIQPAERAKRGLKMEYHPSLIMDGSGQLNIAGGPKTHVPKPDFATVRANQRSEQPIVKKEMKIETPSADFMDPTKNPYYDPTIGGGVRGPKDHVRKSFKFVQQGRWVNEGNQLRAKAQLEKLKQDIAESVKKTGMSVELDLVADQSMRTEPPPAVEWWDAQLVPNGYDNFDAETVFGAEMSVVNTLVQHPIPIQPPAEAADPKLKPLMLTKKEQKKLRRQRRLEIQKEKQDKIRLGLLPPEQSKVKISNLMMVLGNEAILDPTQVEAQVRAQMAARKQKHKDLVAATKLTDAQRKEKKRLKLQEDTSNLVQVAVFRISDLTHPQHRYKVNVNAEQYNLTGCAIVYSGMNLVVVEGGPKGIKAYKKLMLKRIDWTNDGVEDEAAEEEEEARRAAGAGPKEPNRCDLVWEGDVKERNFKFFRFKTVPTETAVREFLEKMRAVHYWDAARNFIAPGV
ncbi:hypothetical protein HKX48_002448 [Thoreauomyces humboldtii]|nr:hypothetical protein HKX48_002448 [Thoreauomyces humboldtii]